MVADPFMSRAAAVATALCLATTASHAWVTTIPSGSRYVYMAVGNATNLANNPTINEVAATLNATQAVIRSAVPMQGNSTQAASVLDGFIVCVVPGQVYIAAALRAPSGTAQGRITVSSPPFLTNQFGNTIPFTEISWTVANLYLNDTTLLPGTFVGGSQQILTLARNRFFEDCKVFSYANSAFVAQGAYTGRVTYTFSTP